MRKSSTFECLRSVNNCLHNKLSQEDEYDEYLKRIDKIIARPQMYTSNDNYMDFLHGIKETSKKHQQNEKHLVVGMQNDSLLKRIRENNHRTMQMSSQTFHYQVPMHIKRLRENKRINRENKKMVDRINKQPSVFSKTGRPTHKKNPRDSFLLKLLEAKPSHPSNQTEHKKHESVYNLSRVKHKKNQHPGWDYSPMKKRKLPRLVGCKARNATESDLSQSQTLFQSLR